MNRREFVRKCGELLKDAKPHLVSCEYKLGSEMPPKLHERYYDNDEYVLVTCENGYTYSIMITANSLCSIAEAIFSKMAYK